MKLTEIEEKTEEADVFDFRKRTRKSAFKLSEQNAQKQLAIFLDYYELYPDEFDTKEQKQLYNMHAGNLIKAIRGGRMEISEPTPGDLKVVQTTRNQAVIEYNIVGFESKMQESGFSIKDQSSMAMESIMPRRNASILGHVSGLGADGIAKLQGVDMSMAESLAFLLGLV